MEYADITVQSHHVHDELRNVTWRDANHRLCISTLPRTISVVNDIFYSFDLYNGMKSTNNRDFTNFL